MKENVFNMRGAKILPTKISHEKSTLVKFLAPQVSGNG